MLNSTSGVEFRKLTEIESHNLESYPTSNCVLNTSDGQKHFQI